MTHVCPASSGNRDVLRLDVARIRSGDSALPEAWTDEDPGLDEISSWGGNALGLAVLTRASLSDPEGPVPLVLTAGSAVGRGLPTAVRASVLSRAPLSGLLSEGQLGGPLGPCLATHADALVLTGRTALAGAVLTLRADGSLRLEAHPELVGADPVTTWRTLVGARGSAAILSIGAVGERGLAFASLAGGGEHPSFVGRGGLGAVLGRLGLKAVVVEPRARRPGTEADELLRALSASPRLAARAADGTLELYGAFAARGDLRARNYAEPLEPERGGELLAEARASATERHGCRGCPTPCGWVFERSDGTRQAAHFSASYALGTNLGLERFEDSLVLLEACDRLALDAKEAGAVLALACRAGELAWGDRKALLARIEAFVDADSQADPAARGAVAYAASLGLEAELAQSRGQSARPESNHASILGQCVTAGGTDPMRSFPFLIEASGRAGLERVCADLGSLPAYAEDPASPVAKGRLVFWHENLVAAVDMTGFCAFSTAGLLADDLCDVERLARWILPPALAAPRDPAWSALGAARRLLAAGANLVLLRRELNRLWGAPADQDRPAWAAARLAEPGMLDEYLDWRGLDEAGHPRAEMRAGLGSPAVLRSAQAGPRGARQVEAFAATERARGRIELCVLGSQSGSTTVEALLPAPLQDVLDLREGTAPAVWRRGRRLEPGDAIRDGDVLDLVTVISGG